MLKYPSGKSVYQFFKYGIAGGIGAGIDLGLYTIIITFIPLNYLLTNTVSFSIGTLVVYSLQKKWTFQYQNQKNAFLFTKFTSVVVITYLLNNLILIICVELFQLSPIVSKFIQIFLSFLWGYIINKKFVFK
jgi:putative flippase GtrA